MAFFKAGVLASFHFFFWVFKQLYDEKEQIRGISTISCCYRRYIYNRPLPSLIEISSSMLNCSGLLLLTANPDCHNYVEAEATG